MKILVTNDDGIEAEGIRVLARVLSTAHQTVVIAPDVERSGTSHSLSFQSSLIYEKAEFPGGTEAYRVYGTPSDCVKFGLAHILRDRPDLVVSGINRGGNLGTDIMYSGTVAAALEAVYLGVQAVAVSASSYFEEKTEYYETAAHYLLNDLNRLLAFRPPRGTLFNVNVPPLNADQIKGVKFTPMGVQEYDDEYYPDAE
ncbi:MAG: 5'/3'-nucleotidase SurE, partial [Clostridiales bacterium]|nr:5'/3'-nucleotidase SurE [Clostridiales bacterium]